MNKNLLILTLVLLYTSAVHTAPLRTGFRGPKDHLIKDLPSNPPIRHVGILRSDKEPERRGHPVPEALEEVAPAIDRFEHEAANAAPEAEAAVKEVPKKAGIAWKWLSGGILSGVVLDHLLHPLSLFTPSSWNSRSEIAPTHGSQRRGAELQQIEDRAVPFKTLMGGVVGGVMLDELFFKNRDI